MNVTFIPGCFFGSLFINPEIAVAISASILITKLANLNIYY